MFFAQSSSNQNPHSRPKQTLRILRFPFLSAGHFVIPNQCPGGRLDDVEQQGERLQRSTTTVCRDYPGRIVILNKAVRKMGILFSEMVVGKSRGGCHSDLVEGCN